MRALALFVALAGCGFRSRAAPDAGADEPDAREPPDAPAPADAAIAFCDPAGGDLVACYELDGDGHDGSPNHLDAVTMDVTFPAGQVGMAMQFGDTSTADVRDSPMFDVAALTIEAWVRLAQLPSPRATILDMNDQYGLVLRDDGSLQCTLVGGPSLAAAAHVAIDQWLHVACTYDGINGALYANGVAIASAGGGQALHTGGMTGISLASDNPSKPGADSRLIGLLDQVRLFKVARAAAQICQDAGRAACP